MIKLCIQYPAAEGGFFDFDYYLETHLPMSEQLLGEFGFCGFEVHRCTTTVSGDDPQFLCITMLEFDSLEGLRQGMQMHGAELREDFARYTDIVPIATVTETAASK